MSPAQKKQKTKSTQPTPTPPTSHQSTPAPAPLSAIAARKAAALLASSSAGPSSAASTPKDNYDDNDDEAAYQGAINSPGPSSPSASATSSDDEEDLLRPEPLSMMMDGELVNLGSSRPTGPSKKERKRKGKGAKGNVPARYWDEDLPEMETQHRGNIEFVGGRGRRGWSPSGPVGGGFDREMGDSEDDDQEQDEVGLDDERGSEVGEDVEDEDRDDEDEGVLTPGRAGKRKRDKQLLASSSPPGGAMSAFLPSFGNNVIRVSEEQLRKAFVDVEEGEGAVVVSLKDGENLIFSGLCTLYPLVSPLAILNATLHPSTSTSSGPSPPSHPVYAPTCYPLPVVTSSSSGLSSSLSSPLLKTLGVSSSDEFVVRFLVRELRTGLEGMGKAVPGFENVWKGDEAGWGVRGFHPILSPSSYLAHDMPASWSSSLNNALPRLPRSLTQPASPDDESDSDSDEEEEDAFAPFTALIKGPKRSGKSTFARSLVNGLLDRYRYVAVLEADLGQGEWGVEGSVSLVVVDKAILGPPFTHPSIPLRSHHIGSPSPRSNPTAYLAAIADLLENYRLNLQYPASHSSLGSSSSSAHDIRNAGMIPLVINTQGWVKGLGMDLLKKIEALVGDRVEFEFEVSSGGDGWEGAIPVEGGWGRLRGAEYEAGRRRALGERDEDEEEQVGQQEGFRSSCNRQNDSRTSANGLKVSNYPLTPIALTTQSSRFTPSDLRTLSLLSYFHAEFESIRPPSSHSSTIVASPLATRWDFSLPLVARRPLVVDWTVALDRICLVGPGAEEVEEDEVLRALDVGLVGLVALDDHEPSSSTSNGSSASPPYSQGAAPPSPSSSNLLGFALVRSTPSSTSSSSSLELLTPLPSWLLPSARVLVKGETEFPVAGMVDWRKDTQEEGWEGVPYLEAKGAEAGIVGAGRRKVRRNVGRRG